MEHAAPVVRDLVLVGGGHTHVAVLKRFGMDPVRGLRITLVTRDVHTPYSGMLPGYIAGHYEFDEVHVDLRPLARFAGARLYHDRAVGIDPDGHRVLCEGRPPIPYDILSLNVGSVPATSGVAGARRHALPVKPVDRFLDGWREFADRIAGGGPARRFRIAVVGGGAAGVEVALSTRHRVTRLLESRGADPADAEFHLYTDTDEILPHHNRRARRKFRRILGEREIAVHLRSRVVRVEEDALELESGALEPADRTLWLTHAAPPDWISGTGLATDERGFIRVNEGLQSTSHPAVFAAGDVAAVEGHPRPKAGVFAVRQGPPLHRNLRRAIRNDEPRRFVPQSRFLRIVTTGDRCAVASRGRWAVEGRWVWRLKDWIDRRWMARWRDLPRMDDAEDQPDASLPPGPGVPGDGAGSMRCGGCGAKVGADVLHRVLARLDVSASEDVLVGLAEPDDAAVTRVPAGMVTVQTVDHFRAFLDDPYILGRVGANHALGDIWAMGARPRTALAIVTLPAAPEAKVEADLHHLLAGAVEVLEEAGAVLAGGHSGEGPEMAFGLQVTGAAPADGLLRKSGARPGQRILLTKPLGTGTLLAAEMRGEAKGRWVDGALRTMLRPGGPAAAILLDHGATACTDVTGYGLAGHLLELLRRSGAGATLDLDRLPVLEGAPACLQEGIVSSLHSRNAGAGGGIEYGTAEPSSASILFDPQTAGGLLAAVPPDAADACLADLRDAGYTRAADIGGVEDPRDHSRPLRVRPTS